MRMCPFSVLRVCRRPSELTGRGDYIQPSIQINQVEKDAPRAPV
jgi:hypothetical protein